ncbi:hypothetical protein [Vreelandella stevensii]|uniref:hypothetical protein n=1 Tax=Vreelandella stevensii TaxID=502821 RepID=UPI003747C195
MKDLYHDPVFYLKTNTWSGGLNDFDAYSKIQERSLSGDPELIVLKSWYIALGKGCEKNISSGIELLENNAVHGHAGALCAAGKGFLKGYYGDPDEDKAFFFFDKAEKICLRKGCYFKGVFYFNQFLTNREDLESFEKAGYYFKKSAKNGHATSLKMYLFCSSKYRALRLVKYISFFFVYMVSRRAIGGPERWWCYRDLEKYRPTTVELAESCGHALGYFAKNSRSR